ncbi:hypothetical protein VTK56DRAFT_5035 [Thermocarpiscus australiensis]
MDLKLDENSIVATFDSLVEQGKVVYNGDYRTVNLPHKGFSFEFRILTTLTGKPAAPRHQQTHQSSEQPGCRPGSDINVSGYEVTTIGSTHLLTVNKYPAARPHFLILTQNGFRRQYEALDRDDIAAAWKVISSLSNRYMVLFNCGIDSGCSRLHKHMQIFPAPDPDKFRLWPDSDDPTVQTSLPYKCFVHRFQSGLPPAEDIFGVYRALLRRAESALGNATLDDATAIPHNMVMDRNWLLVVPRRSAGWNGADTNAAGMLGMVWVHSEDKMNLWLKHGPANILTQLGFPADAN